MLPLLLALVLPWMGCSTTSTRARLATQLNYTTNNNTVAIAKYTGSGGAVIIPRSIAGLPVTSISNSAFHSCTRLASITIPNSVTSIGDRAFWLCDSLTSVIIPNSVTNIGAWAFVGNTHLTNVTIGTGVTRIGDSAFFNCTRLTGVTLPNNVKSIGEFAFDGCPLNGHFIIPDSVTHIGKEAFAASRNLTSITIPKRVTSIGDRAFGSCINLTAITVDPLNPVYSSRDGILFNKNQTTLIQYPGGKLGSVTIPNSVTNIGNRAFKICRRLTSVIIPNSVTSIGNEAFNSCDNLTSITIPNSVASIGDDGFAFCHRLTEIYFQGNAPQLGKDVFNDRCGDSIVDHDPVTVYYLPGTTGWASTLDGRPTVLWTPPEWVYAFETNNNTIIITKHTGSGGVVTIPDKIYGLPVTSIGGMAFYRCTNLTSVTIPNSVTNIGVCAFERCTNLTSLYFQGDAPSLGEDICGGDEKATIYYLPGTTGWESTFGGRPTAVWTPPERWYAFEAINNKIAITKYTGAGGAVIIPDKIKGLPVTSIEARAFEHCSSLASVTIPESVTSIGDGVFSFCTSLTNITIPASVTNIGSSEFYFCTGLSTITVDQRNSFYSGLDGVLFNKDQTTLSPSTHPSCAARGNPLQKPAWDPFGGHRGAIILRTVTTLQSIVAL